MKSSKTTSLVLFLSCISLSSTLSASTICRNAIYLAAFIALIDLVIKKTTVTWSSAFTAVMLILLLSLSIFLPSYLHRSVILYEIDRNYVESARRLLLGFIIAFYLVAHREKISKRSWLGAYLWIFIGFTYTVYLAIKLSSPMYRLEINTVATMTAYIFVILSLTMTYILLKSHGCFRYISVVITLSFSTYILVLTQTRSVLLTYPFLLFLLLLKEKFFTKRSCAFLSGILLIVVVTNLQKIYAAGERIALSVNEYQAYQQNDENTSLGARFSMWKAGLNAFNGTPFGESADQRDVIALRYLNQYENGNPEAIRSIKNHYHNDILEAATLHGWVGLLVLLTFYIGTIVASRRFTGSFNITLLLIVPTMIYGSMDTLLIDHRYVTILVLLLPFYLCCETRKKPGQTVVSANALR